MATSNQITLYKGLAVNGAEILIKTLVNNGVEVCFTNPGTSEMHFVAALDEVAGMRCVLGLFEGVVSGAADGYARMARKPAATLLHLGPGLGNALANIHNASKAHVPMINIVGDHATYHLQYDTPLTADIEGIAGPVSDWVRTPIEASSLARDTTEAIGAAGNSQIATLVLPADVSWSNDATSDEPAVSSVAAPQVEPQSVEAAVQLLRSEGATMLLVGGREVSAELGLSLGRIAQATGARICLETFPTRVGRGAGTAPLEKLPYLAEQAIEFLADVDHLILVGAKAPVSFFAYPGVPSELQPEGCRLLQLAEPDDDLSHWVEALLAAVDGEHLSPTTHPYSPPELPQGELNAFAIAQSIAQMLPDDAIVVDEGATSSLPVYPITATAAPHDWLSLTGGSIGFGLPCAVGAAIACPDRKVICLEGDGSAMYTIQSLWTMARERLDITMIIFNNQKYNILELEFARTGARGGSPGPMAASMLNIGSPDMDFATIAQGMGVKAVRVNSAEAFNHEFAQAMTSSGPHLIDAMIPPLTLT